MARQNHGPLSRAKGKLGGVVYQQYEGMQISREYQPVVKNPQTTKQTQNRAKFKTASQVVAQFSEVVNVRLAKLSIYTRIRRGAAVNVIFKEVAPNDNTFDASFVDIVNGLNAKSMATIESPVVASGANNTVNITATSGDVVTYIGVSYDTDGKMMSREIETFTSDGSTKEITPAAHADTFAVMVVAVRATTEAGRATLSNIAGINEGFTLEVSRSVAAGDVEISDIAGVMSQLS